MPLIGLIVLVSLLTGPMADPARMLQLVRDFSEHADGTPKSRYCFRTEMDGAEEALQDRFAVALGSRGSVALWPFTPKEPPEEWPENISFRTMFNNVVAVLPGTEPDGGRILVTSHFDAIGTRTAEWKPWEDPAPGADDNLSGTAAVVEMARLMAADDPYPFDVEFICFDGEELGLWGSDTLAKAYGEAGVNVLGVLNMDMIGYNPDQDSIVVMTNRRSTYLADYMVETESLDPQSGFRFTRSINNIFISDQGPFWEQGYPGVMMIENIRIVLHNPQYHRVTDTAATLSRDGRMMAYCANAVLKTVRRLAGGASSPVRYSIDDDDLILSINRLIETGTATPGDSIRIDAGFFNVGGRYDGGTAPVARCYRVDRGAPTLLAEHILDASIPTGGHFSIPIDLRVESGDVGAITILIELDQNGETTAARRAVPVRGRVNRVTEHYMAPNPVRSLERAHLAYELSLEASIRVTVFDLHGHEIARRFYPFGGVPSQPDPGTATGLNRLALSELTRGADLAPGAYVYRIEVFPEGSSQSISSVTGKFAILR